MLLRTGTAADTVAKRKGAVRLREGKAVVLLNLVDTEVSEGFDPKAKMVQLLKTNLLSGERFLCDAWVGRYGRKEFWSQDEGFIFIFGSFYRLCFRLAG